MNKPIYKESNRNKSVWPIFETANKTSCNHFWSSLGNLKEPKQILFSEKLFLDNVYK